MKVISAVAGLRWGLVACLFVGVHIGAATVPVEQWLDAYGLRDDHAVAMVWSERVVALEDVFVWGCKLLPHDGTAPMDVYFDETGTWLTPSELAALGVVEKRWEDMPVDIPAAMGTFHKQPPAATTKRPFAAATQPPLYVLPPVNHEQLLDEDAQREAKRFGSLMRYGVGRTLEAPLALSGRISTGGVLYVEDDGTWVWENILLMKVVKEYLNGMQTFID